MNCNMKSLHLDNKKIVFPEDTNPFTHEQKLNKAGSTIKRIGERHKHNNTPRKPYTFKIGDKALVMVSHLSSAFNKQIEKFFHLYQGTFVIKEKICPNAYILISPENNQILRRCNSNHLKPYKI